MYVTGVHIQNLYSRYVSQRTIVQYMYLLFSIDRRPEYIMAPLDMKINGANNS